MININNNYDVESALQHNSSPSHFVPDMMGALQLLPQLHLIWIRKKHISSALARFAGFMMLARLTSLIYWWVDCSCGRLVGLFVKV